MNKEFSLLMAKRTAANPELRLVKLALESLMRTGAIVIPCDKDGGWCILPRSLYLLEEARILIGGDYIGTFGLDSRTLHRDYRAMVRYVCELPDCKIFSVLMSSWKSPRSLPFGVLQLNCKSHKVPVGFRNIHASSNNKF